MIIWKGNAILLPLFACLGPVVFGIPLGLAADFIWPAASNYTIWISAILGIWTYIYFFGKGKEVAAVHPHTGQTITTRIKPSLYFIPVNVWAVILTLVIGFIGFSASSGDLDRSVKESDADILSGKVNSLDAADRLLGIKGEHGHGTGARELAEVFADGLRKIRSVTIEDKSKFKSTSADADFITYCRITEDGKLLFLTRVPGLRKFTKEAKSSIGIAAWRLANSLAEKLEPQPNEIAVGVRGIVAYSEFLIGGIGESPRRVEGDSKTSVREFFTTPLGEAEVEKEEENVAPTEEGI